jgi:hypothetical protein
MRGLIVGLIMLVFYVAVFIPFILPPILSMFIDWVNNSGDMLIQQYCTQRQVLVNNTYTTVTECTQFDFRPLIVFLFQLTVYLVAPVYLIYRAVRGRW